MRIVATVLSLAVTAGVLAMLAHKIADEKSSRWQPASAGGGELHEGASAPRVAGWNRVMEAATYETEAIEIVEREGDAFRPLSEVIADLYRRGTAAALVTEFTPAAEYVDGRGHLHRGRHAVARALSSSVGNAPDAQIELHPDSIHFVSPSVAIEDGHTTVRREAGDSFPGTRYTAVHVMNGGKWYLASMREQVAE